MKDFLKSVEDGSDTATKFSAATLSASLTTSTLLDDFATSLADGLAGMNLYFMMILVVLFLEKILIRYEIKTAFAVLIPSACLVGPCSLLPGEIS